MIKQIEKIERLGEPIFSNKTTASDMRNWIQAKINKCIKEGNSEYEFFFNEIMNAYNHFHPISKENNLKLEIEIVSGWKGIGDTRVYMGFDNDFRIRVPIKDKATGIVKFTTKEVLKEDLNAMIKIIKGLELNMIYTCYDIANLMGLDWKEDVWKNRGKVYFKRYYNPIKVLEALKIIEYGGDGTIKRII